MPSTIGVIGHGAFGALLETLVQRFAPTMQIRIHSSRREADGKRFFTIEDACKSDALVLAVPISVYAETLEHIQPHLGARTILVDVATVKVHTVELLKKHAHDRRYIATHPMWGPESYEKRGGDVSGFRIVVAEHTLQEGEYESLANFFKQIGFDVVRMSAAEHDKHLAETLFLTHFIGQVIAHAGFTRTEIDTVSFGYLMDAVESVKHDTQLFRDVFEFNPFCRDILDRFEVSEQAVRKLLDESSRSM